MMKCARCQHENHLGAKFCEECATPLTRACASCHAPLSASAKFCSECAHPVDRGAQSPPLRFGAPAAYTPTHLAERILTSKAALEGERKQVTVLFVDLKGSMELLADRDPEEARKLLDPVLERMMEAVHRYEGTVNQVMGDGIMALFGAPLAHEDHAVRACYAALRMQETVKRYAEDIRRSHGVTVQIRVGLNSGEVVVRAIGSDLHMDYTAVGQTTHLAARMEQLALPGSVLITADTLRLAEGYVEVKALGFLPVKGLAGPVEAYEVVGAGPVRTRLQASAARGLTRFVGRDEEMEQLRRALEAAHAGRGQVVAVVGEPGVGKSRLFYELLRSHRTHGWLVLESASVSYGRATAYSPVLELLRSYFKIVDGDDSRAVRVKVTGTLLTLDPALQDALPAVLALLDGLPPEDAFTRLDPPERRQLTLSSLRRLFLRESRVQPLLLVFEDLHWIDSETQALLDNLVESLPSAAILLAVNYRPEYRHGWGSKTFYRQIRIDPLPPESAEALLNALVGDDASLKPLARLLIERTEGNPFFLEESVRMLIETGDLTGERGRFRLAGAVESIQVPVSVQVILAARIDRLSPEDKQLLHAASVVGKDVPLALLEAVADFSPDRLAAGLGRLQAAEFLYETRLFPDPEYTFKHALTHEVAYGSLLSDRRRELHRRIVATIEQRSGPPGDEVERLAHHSLRGEQWEKAAGYLRQAGLKATAQSASREAVAWLEQAIAAIDHLPSGRERDEQAIDVRLDLRSPLFRLAEFRRIASVLQEAQSIATDLDDRSRLGWVLAFLANVIFQTGDLEEAMECIQRAARIADALGKFELRIIVNMYLSQILFGLGEYGRAIEVSKDTVDRLHGDLDRERFGQVAMPTIALRGFLGRQLGQVGEFDDALRLLDEAMRDAEVLGRPFDLCLVHYVRGEVSASRGAVESAAPVLERGLAIARAADAPFQIVLNLGWLGYSYAVLGRLDEGVASLEESTTRAEAIGFTGGMAAMLKLQGDVYLRAGRRDEARASAQRGLEICRRLKRRGSEAETLHLLGEIAATSTPPDLDASAAHYRQAMALAEQLGMRPLIAHCHFGLGKLYRRTGQSEQARGHLASATTMYREMEMRLWLEQAEIAMTELRWGQRTDVQRGA
jgi:class 3 adenylate cyclase/tetratricopeptide (TPR) repeat protein